MAGNLKCSEWAAGEINVKNLRGWEQQPLFSIAAHQTSVAMLQVQGVFKSYATPRVR